MGILSDLFPGIALPEHDYGLLHEAIHNSLVEAGLQPIKQLITKVCIQNKARVSTNELFRLYNYLRQYKCDTVLCL
jgi:hypothetical protein